MNSKINIIACDLAIRGSGIVYGEVQRDEYGLKFPRQLHHEELITQPPMKGMEAYDRMMLEAENAMKITDRIAEIAKYLPNRAIAIEIPYASQSSRSAILLGLCWMVAEILQKRDRFDVCRIHPLNLKEHITGYRSASKDQVRSEMISKFGSLMSVHSDHIVDAYATMITYLEKSEYSEATWREGKIS